MVMMGVWIAVAIHTVVAVITWRRSGALPLVPLVNLAVALAVLAYWVNDWYGYMARGVRWDYTDQAQLVPLYALVVSIIAGLALAGRYQGVVLNRVAFGFDGVAFLAFAIFLPLLKINRLF